MLRKISLSLPVQLLLLNLKRNQSLLLFWILLIAIISGHFAKQYGIPYLFLDPEYRDHVDYISMGILGLSFGIFTMSYNITFYILESYRFHFLALNRDPFPRFCLNNFMLPVLFLTIFIPEFIHFQLTSGIQSYSEITLEILGFFIGWTTTLCFTFLYFQLTGKAIFKALSSNVEEQLRGYKTTRVNIIQKLKVVKKKRYHTEYYLDLPCKVRRVDGFIPIDKERISLFFDRNHINAILLELAGFAIILTLGYFRDNSFFQLPAGASIFLLFSIIMMFLGAFSYWLKGWSIYIMIMLVVAINIMIGTGLINPDYEAFGLNYSTKPAAYSRDILYKLSSSKNYNDDKKYMLQIFENWKAKFPTNEKPKIVFICSSGGGQRSASWTLQVLQKADSISQGKLMKNTFCMTGASGGLVGAAFYRSLALKAQSDSLISLNNPEFEEQISKDILNPVVFSLVVNDLFLRFQHFSYDGKRYIKDRGYSFENRLNENTLGILDGKITDFKKAEFESKIPLLILSPSIVNDGRKLYISPHPVSYLTSVYPGDFSKLDSKVNGIEFMRFFKDQNADNLRFLSALRMSATFPYITPNINLPSSPSMEIMDAGLTDNFGIVEAIKFIHVFKDWILENTSGVVIVTIRDSPKELSIEKNTKKTFLQKIVNPIGSLYNNWTSLQDAHNDYYVEYASTWLQGKLEVIDFQYAPNNRSNLDIPTANRIKNVELTKLHKEQKASLSWHLTKREKLSITETLNEPHNVKSFEELQLLLTSYDAKLAPRVSFSSNHTQKKQ